VNRTWHVVVSPAQRGTFTASVDGEPIGVWRTPLLSAARHLLATRNAHPDDEITLQHAGSTSISMHSSVGTAAKLTVKEDSSGPRFKLYNGSESRAEGSQTATDAPESGHHPAADAGAPGRSYSRVAA
jgi:hypothetical protein